MRFLLYVLFIATVFPRFSWAADCRDVLSLYLSTLHEREHSSEIAELISHTDDVLVGPRVPFSRNDVLSRLFTKNIIQGVLGYELRNLGYSSEKDVREFLTLFRRQSPEEKIKFVTSISDNIVSLIGNVPTSLRRDESIKPMSERASQLGLELDSYIELAQTLAEENALDHLILKAAILQSLQRGEANFVNQIIRETKIPTTVTRNDVINPKQDLPPAPVVSERNASEPLEYRLHTLEIFYFSGIVAKALRNTLEAHQFSSRSQKRAFLNSFSKSAEVRTSVAAEIVKQIVNLLAWRAPLLTKSNDLGAVQRNATELDLTIFEFYKVSELLAQQQKDGYKDLQIKVINLLRYAALDTLQSDSRGLFLKSRLRKRGFTIPLENFRTLFAPHLESLANSHYFTQDSAGEITSHQLLMGITKDELFFVLAQPLNTIFPKTTSQDSIVFRYQISKKDAKDIAKVAHVASCSHCESFFGRTLALSDGSYLHLVHGEGLDKNLTIRDLDPRTIFHDGHGGLVRE